MAVYRQNLHDPADTTEAQTGNTRGCLPPELRGSRMLHKDGSNQVTRKAGQFFAVVFAIIGTFV